MHDKHLILSIIYQIVKGDSNPTSFPCNTRDIILRYVKDWPQAQLEELEREGLIKMQRTERLVIYITGEGIAQAQLMNKQLS